MINAAVRQAQQQLLAAGYDIGKSGADGVLGPKTRAAIGAFQKRTGMPQSGMLTAATLQALQKHSETPAPPTPRPRPELERLGSGNTNVMPRLRPGDKIDPTPSAARPDLTAGSKTPDANPSPPQSSLPTQPFDPGDNLDQASAPTYMRPAVNATSLAMGLGRRVTPPATPIDFTAPQSPARPDLQNSLNDAAAKEQLRQQLWQMIFGARVQPRPNQPAYSDQYATPSTPPAFTTPSGMYR